MLNGTLRAELIALLRAVKAEPEDDTPKLALADWLQEQEYAADRARGEYLRILVAHRSLASSGPTHSAVVARQSELWRNHPAWLGPLPGAGFRCSNHSNRWGLLNPSIEGRALVSAKAMAVAGSEEYAWVAGLILRELSSRQNSQFVNSPLIESLIALDYERCVHDPAPLVELARAPGATGLKSLKVFAGRFGREGSTALSGLWSEPFRLGGLRELDCRTCDIGGDDGFRLLCDSFALNELQSLTVTGAGLTLRSARAFADGEGLPLLRALNLGDGQIGPDGTVILVHKPVAGRLQDLNLSTNGIADYGVEAICRHDHLYQLTHLDLSNNRLTDRSAVAIANAPHLGSLEEINLQGNHITGAGALALAKGQFLGNLRSLNLWRNEIGDRGIAALRERFGERIIL